MIYDDMISLFLCLLPVTQFKVVSVLWWSGQMRKHSLHQGKEKLAY